MNNKDLLKGTMVYSLANIVTKMGSFIFLPIITKLLTQEEYGIIGLLEPIATLGAVIFGLGIYNAQMKKYSELNNDEDELGSFLFSSVLIIFTLGIIIFLFLFTDFSKKIFLMLKLGKVQYNLIIITFIIAFLNCLNNLAISLFRMKKMYFKVAIGSTLKLFIHYLLVIYLIKFMKLGVYGERIGNLIATIILFLFVFKDYFGKFKLKFQSTYAKYSISNGLPLIFIELTDQIINFSDRYVMQVFVPLATMGAYNLAYTGGRALSVVTSAFINSWTPEFYETMKKDKTNPQITKSLENFVGLATFVCVLAQLFAPEGIILIFDEKYEISIKYISYIFPSIVIASLVCLDYFFHFHEESKYIFYFSIFAMIFNLGGNLIFMPLFPQYSVYIGLWTTIISFLLRAFLEMFIIKKRYGIVFNYKKFLFYFLIIINPIIFYLSDEKISLQKFGFKIVYLLIVTKLLVNKEIYTKIKGIFRKIKSKIFK